ncbi:MAG: hypothetical protein GY906_10260 [bacterium]|nr:hypothetical protein [bacterium]
MKLTDAQRERLLSIRLKCEHGKLEAHRFSVYHDESMLCSGGASAAELCDTCGGSDDLATYRCHDCEGVGIRLLVGQLIEWCTVHDAPTCDRGHEGYHCILARALGLVDIEPKCVFVAVYQVGPQHA